jgi:hypothetical protein
MTMKILKYFAGLILEKSLELNPNQNAVKELLDKINKKENRS